MIEEIARKIAKAIDDDYNSVLEQFGIVITKDNANDYIGRIEIVHKNFDSSCKYGEQIFLDGKLIAERETRWSIGKIEMTEWNLYK